MIAGSSPLARGLPQTATAFSRPLRIIPARAGFTPPRRPPPTRSRDHPRSRGVYSSGMCGRTASPGSSPLARGLLVPLPHSRARARIIPARAGFTGLPPCGRRADRDHPRSRGVYSSPSTSGPTPTGSSPLARGLQGVQGDVAEVPGIIPARAGFTRLMIGFTASSPDHPRSRGVYEVRVRGADGGGGSSPLARGLPAPLLHRPGGERIIPARAGFTRRRRVVALSAEDHPRSRGVYPPAGRGRARGQGSSPLARGLLVTEPWFLDPTGIIPARAGFTQPTTGRLRARRDHPRSRGVYRPSRTVVSRPPGSSPLARGLHVAVVLPWDGRGIIPARTGFTRDLSPLT